MKTSTLLVFLLSCFVCGSMQAKEPDYPPQVKEFIQEALQDEDAQYANIEKALLSTPKKEKFRDQKIEILSGLVWNTDRKRAHALLKHIENKKLREQIERQYKTLEKVNPEESETV